MDESDYLLVILPRKNGCENVDPINARSAACFLQPIFAVVQDVIVTAIDCAFYIYTLLMYTNTRSIEAEQLVCTKIPTPK